MTTPSTGPNLGLPAMCPSHGTCYASIASGRLQVAEIIDLKLRVKHSDDRVEDLERRLDARNATIEISKLGDRIRDNQANETRLQRSVDRLECENAMLRQVLRTNGYDMMAVDKILGDIKMPASMLTDGDPISTAIFG